MKCIKKGACNDDSKEVEKTFQALYALENLRELSRRTTPYHKLTPEQKREAKATINKVRKAMDQIEGGALGKIKTRMREELYINLNPLQRGGIVPAEVRRTASDYINGYFTCAYCLKTLRLIKNPPIQDFLRKVADFLNMRAHETIPHACIYNRCLPIELVRFPLLI